MPRTAAKVNVVRLARRRIAAALLVALRVEDEAVAERLRGWLRQLRRRPTSAATKARRVQLARVVSRTISRWWTRVERTAEGGLVGPLPKLYVARVKAVAG